VRGYVLNDQEHMRGAADAYDPNIPAHENPDYVNKSKEYLDRFEQAMHGNSAAFGSRIDRGWVPPTLDDLEAEVNSNDPHTQEN
jgi:CPA2 family monovalent cation:H+ antiporter-2